MLCWALSKRSPHLIRSYHCKLFSVARFASSVCANGSLSPVLLARAQASAREHKHLVDKIGDSYDVTIAKRAGELAPIADALRQWQSATNSLRELNDLLKDPKTDAELRELASEDIVTADEQVASASQILTIALVPRHPFEDLPCLLEIQPGVGGSEAALFAGDLLRMYQSFCSNVGLQAKLLKYEDADGISDPNGSDAPLKEAILEIEGEGAYGKLKSEAGVHRVQRVPVTESKGRVHTSVAAVLVLPSLPDNANDVDGNKLDYEDPESDYYVNASDVRTEVMRARGAGGQHVNTTDSKVRLTHVPTGTVVAVEDGRSQLKNRAKAWQILRSKLAQAKRDAREEEMLKMRRSVTGVGGKMGRADKIRTYNWNQQRVTDHRSGITVHQLDDVMQGGESLSTIIESVKLWFHDREVEGLLADEDSKLIKK